MPSLPIRRRTQQWISFLQLPFSGPVPLNLTYKPVFGGAPVPYNTTDVPSFAGLYAIMVYDATWRPLPYRLIYVGEAGNLAERVCSSHEKYPSWVRAASGGQLFAAFHAVVRESARKTAERQLIEHYGPECNKTYNHNALTLRSLMGLYTGGMDLPCNL